MVEEIKLQDEKNNILDVEVKSILKKENSKFINMYYRTEGTFIFSLVSLIFAIFIWDEISDLYFYFTFTVILNLMLMVFFIFKHLRTKQVI